ncbi:MAG: hypothetical protein U5L02_06430 [Rheinheimera sp.]|nr:hypothetical protein [Rheinheimera sp.]
MTFLELCRRVRLDSGISGDIATVDNQQGIMAVKLRVREADYDILKSRTDWTFMQRSANAALQVGKAEYLPADLNMQPFAGVSRVYVDKVPAIRCEFDELDDLHLKQGCAPSGVPQRYAVTPLKRILFDHAPTDAAAVALRYNALPIRMTANSSVSLIPDEHHEIIVQKALMSYASMEQDDKLLRDATQRFDLLHKQLCNSYLPELKIF